MIGSKFNFEDIFMRDLTVGVLYTLEDKVKWRNRFSSGDVFVKVPIYYSLSGDERFLLDSFSDDIVSENRYVELNTDTIPRGHLTLTGFNIKSDEFANPNVWLKMVVENEWEIRKTLAQVRAIPITVNYDLEILVSSEIDTFKCSQALMDTMWIYKFIYFEHNFMNIDAVITLPDSNTIQITREKSLSSDNKISVKLSFSVETYYPAWRSDKFADNGYIIESGDGMSDLNGYNNSGVVPWYMSGTPDTDEGTPFPLPGMNLPKPVKPKTFPSGITGSIWPNSTSGTRGTSGSSGTSGTSGSGTTGTSGVVEELNNGTSAFRSETNGYSETTLSTNPRRSKWYDNILRARDEFRKR
jgi:hypothetical protein